MQLPALLYRQNILAKERSFLPIIWIHGPVPMTGMRPIPGIAERRNEAIPRADDAPPAMIKMQMCQQHIGDVIPMKTQSGKGRIERIGTMQIIVREEFRILLIADAIVHQD